MKKYLIVGTLIVLSLAVLAPKIFVPQALAIIDCGLDTCSPNTFSCNDSSGVCAIDNPGGEFDSRGACRTVCKPVVNSFTISPSSVPYGTPVSASWNFTGGGLSCTGYVDGSSAGSVPAVMNNLQLGLPGPAGNVGSHSAYISCTNPSGTTFSPTRYWTVTAPPSPSPSPRPRPSPVTSLSLSPSTVTIGQSVTATWSSTEGATSCTPTVDNANGNGVTTYPNQFGPSGTYGLLSWNVKGTFGLSMYCTNANGDGATVRKTVTVTGTLSIDPQSSAVAVNRTLDYAAFYNNGSGIQVIGAGANLTSSNSGVIDKNGVITPAGRVQFKGQSEGAATISGSYDGLSASTPVTVTPAAYNINFSANPNQLLYWNLGEHGGSPYPISISISGAPANSSGNLSRTEYEYNNYINVGSPHTTRTTQAANWKSTDASGNNNSTSNHSCDNDGTGVPVKGYRIEADTKVTFPGAGTSNSLNVTKDCRATVVVQNPQGSIWTANGPTAVNSSNVSTIQQYQNLGSGSVSYGVTDGSYTITGIGPSCSITSLASQTIIPGHTITFTISCPSGGPATHFECLGNSCASFPGGGGNQNGCTSAGQSCSGGSNHLACVSNSCAIVAGGGANQGGCTSVSQGCTSSPLACFPGSQSVTVGQGATISASGGTGTYTWSGGGSPANGSGSSFATTYSTTGAKTVTLNDGSTTDSCTVNVTPVCPGSQTNPHSACSLGSCSVSNTCGTTDCSACPPASPVSCGGPTNGTTGQNLTFTAANGSGSYAWTGGGTPATGGGSNFTTSFSAAGAKTIRVNDGVGTATCSVNISAATHYACSGPGGSCVVNAGGPYTASDCGGACGGGCSAPNSNPYYTCSSNTCTKVLACGTNSGGCNGSNVGSPCGGGSHSECVNNACTSVSNTPGNTANRCGTDADCGCTNPAGCGRGGGGGGGGGGPIGGICGGTPGAFVCMNVAGSGTGCFNDSGCANPGSPSHLECQSASCVIVGGAGSNDPGCDAIGKTCSACALTASPSLINIGGSALLKWTCADTVSSCTLKAEGSGVDLAGGAANNQVGVKVTPSKSTTYTLNCTQGVLPVTTTAAVKVFNLQECNPNDPTCKPPGT